MGIYRRKKHYSEKGEDATDDNGSSNGGRQKKLTPYNRTGISKSDINDFLLPVLKEVGKCICPPAALPIEVLYQLYKHADSIKEVAVAVVSGDYKKAAKVVIKESMKEATGAVLKSAMAPGVDQTSEVLAEGAKSCLPTNDQNREVAGKIVKGTTKGFAEGIRGKIVKKIVNEVFEDEKQ